MDATDTLELAVLGVCSESPMAIARVVEEIRCIGRGDWSPCTGTVATTIERLVEARLLCRGTGDTCLRLTKPGRRQLCLLLQRGPLTAATPLGRVGLSLRLCFLLSIPSASRDRVMRAILDAHRRELDGITKVAESHQRSSGMVRRWLSSRADLKQEEIRGLGRDARFETGNSTLLPSN